MTSKSNRTVADLDIDLNELLETTSADVDQTAKENEAEALKKGFWNLQIRNGTVTIEYRNDQGRWKMSAPIDHALQTLQAVADKADVTAGPVDLSATTAERYGVRSEDQRTILIYALTRGLHAEGPLTTKGNSALLALGNKKLGWRVTRVSDKAMEVRRNMANGGGPRQASGQHHVDRPATGRVQIGLDAALGL